MNKIDYRKQFTVDAEAYDKLTQSKHVRLIYELEKEVLVKLLVQINSKEKTVMDFACGSGRWTHFLENYFKETTGVDVSEVMIASARQKCSKAEFIVTDITAEAVDKRLEGRELDVVTAFRFYKNAEEELRRAVTDAIPKYLKKDGLFIFDLHLNTFSIMGMLGSMIRLCHVQRLLRVSSLTVRSISLGYIRRLFEDSPFEIIDYYGMGLLPGRSNCTILPRNLLYRSELFLTRKKMLRNFSYNILVVARKKVN